jgi:phospholipid/cholesterol/gamma-HCH transport system substrate-binding protein
VSRRVIAIGTAVLVVLAVVGTYLIVHSSGSKKTVEAEFPRAVGLYTGSSVRILGVPVGKITKITPNGKSVTVKMQYDGKYKVPADAGAAIVPPSIVGDRYVQLTPAYTGGAVLKDDAKIPLSRTEVPAELDDIFASLDQLNKDLGPQGANANGALSRLISVGAQDLGDGNGQRLHDALHDLSQLVATLDNSKGDLVGVINHLGAFTTTLANDDSNVRKVNDDLAQVAGELAGEREDLSKAVENLSIALGEIQSLVKDNRANLTYNIAGLANISGVLVKEKNSLTEFLDVAPLALSNLQKAFDPGTNSLATRGNFDFSLNPAQELIPFVCSINFLKNNPAVKPACDALTSQAAARDKATGASTSIYVKSFTDLLGVRK